MGSVPAQVKPKKEKAALRVLEGGGGGSQKISTFGGIYYGRPVALHVREFGALFGAILFALCALTVYRHGLTSRAILFLVLGCSFPVLGYTAPRALFFLWKWWMGLAHVLGMVMTSLILSLAWSLVLMPTAFVLRILGKSSIGSSKFEKDKASYWEERKEDQDFFKNLERQF